MSTESLAVVATGLSVFALLVAVALAVHVGRLGRAYDGLVAGEEGASFLQAMRGQSRATSAVSAEVDALRADLAGVRADLAGALRHVAVVRYDAFGDLAGALSFSVALLDDAGDGLLLTSINGRSETRTYTKAVRGGRSEAALSPEEKEALAEAQRPAATRTSA